MLTLGTGMGFALYVDGHYVPNIEMAHHPFRKKKTYEELVGNAALHKVGKKRWNRRVQQGHRAAGADLQLPRPLPRRRQRQGDRLRAAGNVKMVENIAGLLGGVKLWQQPG